MKRFFSFATILITLLLSLITGCSENNESNYNNFSSDSDSTKTGTSIDSLKTPVSILTGKIVQIQTGSLIVYTGNGYVFHEFKYVMVEGTDGGFYILIYPYAVKAIWEKEATIKFRPLHNGQIDSNTFINLFLFSRNDASFINHLPIEADGIIINNGIQYK